MAVLLWQMLRRWRVSEPAAFLAGLSVAVHPVHVDVVDTMVGRAELLVALFLLAAFIAARREGVGAGVVVCLCYLAALLSKEHAITFLALLPISDLFLDGAGRCRRRWPLYLALAAIAGSWLIWRQVGIVNPLPRFGIAEAASPLAAADLQTRVLTALSYQGLYFAKLVWPFSLQAVYAKADLPAFLPSLFSVRGALVVSALAAAGIALALGWRRRSLFALFALLYLASFSPTANVVFPIGVSFAERLAYFPSVWFCAASGQALAALARRWPGKATVFWLLAGGYVLVLGGLSLQRNPDYGSNLRLWSAEVVNNPKDFLAWETLAQALNAAGRVEEAEGAFRIMLELAPDYPAGLRSVTSFYSERGLYRQALPTARKAFALSRQTGDTMRMAYDGEDLADIALGLGQCQEALGWLDGAAHYLAGRDRWLIIRGGALSCLGRNEEAVNTLARIPEDYPGHRVRYLEGLSLQRLGRLPAARQQLERAVRQFGDGEAWNLLGVICAQLSDWPAAVNALERAVALDPSNRHYHDNLERARRQRP